MNAPSSRYLTILYWQTFPLNSYNDKRSSYFELDLTFSMIFTLRRPHTVESCLVIISFLLLPEDCLV